MSSERIDLQTLLRASEALRKDYYALMRTLSPPQQTPLWFWAVSGDDVRKNARMLMRASAALREAYYSLGGTVPE